VQTYLALCQRNRTISPDRICALLPNLDVSVGVFLQMQGAAKHGVKLNEL
jgi:hypothetical protein